MSAIVGTLIGSRVKITKSDKIGKVPPSQEFGLFFACWALSLIALVVLVLFGINNSATVIIAPILVSIGFSRWRLYGDPGIP
jgi:hypothetical protein